MLLGGAMPPKSAGLRNALREGKTYGKNIKSGRKRSVGGISPALGVGNRKGRKKRDAK